MNIYEPAGRAREYSPLALNYFKGCDHGCVYCYVPNMLGRFNSKYNHNEVISPIDFTQLKKSAAKNRGCGKQILLSFTGDPYCNTENGETTQVLEILNFYEHKVAILTKNPLKAYRDIELIKQFGDRIKVGSTLTCDNSKDSKIWEPGAPEPSQRIKGLRLFTKGGVKTWVSFEPVIYADQSINMLRQVAPFIDHVRIGKINNHNGHDKGIDWARFIFDAVRICRSFEVPFYIKKDLALFNNGVYLSGNELNEDLLNL